MRSLVIDCGASRCEILPELGGSLGSWQVGEQHLLRAASVRAIEARDPYGVASFPLVPFSNRVGGAQFEWLGGRVKLVRNFPPEPHAIHGVGFERPWSAQEVGPSGALLSFTHAADAHWPWPFRAMQRIEIGERQLRLELEAINLAPLPVPLAFGHHPYFPAAGARLAFAAEGVWSVGADGLPQQRREVDGEFDFAAPRPVAGCNIDHCYVGWQGSAAIDWDGKPWGLRLTASRTLPAAVLYLRADAEAFCLEPVPHLNNALNRPGAAPAMPVIAPGASFQASVTFEAHASG